MKPSAFIGSSGLKYEIVEAIANRLSEQVEPHPWKAAFPVGRMTLEALVEEARLVDFGIFVFGADDRLADDVSIPRDNVLYEAGLFAGVLGTRRCLIVHDKQAKRPSDLEGMTVASFDAGNSAAQVADAVCPALFAAIHKNGPKRFETVAGTIEGHWWQFSRAPDGGFERAKISFLRFRRSASGYLTFMGDAWRADGKRLSRFESELSVVHEASREFTYDWAGEWFVSRDEIEADPEGFYGTGTIVFRADNPNRASGRFTTRNDSNPKLEDRTPVEYQRAQPEDTSVMDGDALSARVTVIQRRLDEGLADR